MIDWKPRTIARGLGFPEGPVFLGDGKVAFTEIEGQCVSIVEDGRYRVVAKTGGGANGATLGRDGALYVANNGGLHVAPTGYWHAPDPIDGSIQRVTLGGAVEEVVARLPLEPPHRPNDLCFGPDGKLYFTDPRNWDDLANLKVGRVWRADVDTGEAEVVAEVPNFCNGIAFGPDDRLYVAQSIGMKIVAIPWSAAGLGEAQDFAVLPQGFPDGFCFAASGELIVCGSMGHVIQVFDPGGALVQTVTTAEHTEPTNCCIGAGVLYVTLSGIGELVACEIDADPLLLYPARAAKPSQR